MFVESTIQTKIDKNIETEATAALAAMGLTVSDAFRLMMIRIANDRALPFEPLIPNKETIDAMESTRRGELIFAGSPENLLASLNGAED
uniref:DNA-damage-inducible protein J n=1 Tax=Candidatus Kentrum sp. SD TaxID=2126332 RepID=A0A451BP16_9GAMM|nr:MAG: DNA-damage-inducible protein J [Candidatus Kentron sp. SD]VFK40341.1 MAG: DNA-damage-inducible protein J [Candidatus Kentron sp. SD]VFK80008.1 MAG: DNA-damage-inducible protein J [Candidatus Kentron sp. SD]